jgi:hypothetical protein
MKFMKAYRVLEDKMYIEKLIDHLLIAYGSYWDDIAYKLAIKLVWVTHEIINTGGAKRNEPLPI